MSVGHTADIENNPNSFVFGGKAGFGMFHREPGAYQYIAKFWEDDPDGATKELTMRANDGGVDGRGRYWLGTMNDPPVKQPGPVGALYFACVRQLLLHKPCNVPENPCSILKFLPDRFPRALNTLS